MFLTPPNNKRRYYQLIYFIGKKRTKISTGTADKEKAEEFLRNFVPQPRQPKQKPVIIIKKNTIKISNFANEYKEYVSNNYSAKYLKKIVAPSLRVFQTYLTDIPLENISTRNVDQFISSTAAKSKFTASLYYRTLKAAFNKAVTWNYIKENPFNKIKPPKVKKSYPAFINFNELEIINSNTEKKFLTVLFTTAFFSGMRLAELVNMKWSWINFQNNIITVKCDESFTTKNRKERIVPLNLTLRGILLNYKPNIISINYDDFVFSVLKGIRLNEDFVSKHFKKAVRKSGLSDKIHFHSLRHSFCSNLVQKGASLYIVKELAGHADMRMAQNYSHLLPENLHNAVNLL